MERGSGGVRELVEGYFLFPLYTLYFLNRCSSVLDIRFPGGFGSTRFSRFDPRVRRAQLMSRYDFREREAIGKLPCVKIQFGRTWRNIEIWLERTLIRLGTEDGTRESYNFS